MSPAIQEVNTINPSDVNTQHIETSTESHENTSDPYLPSDAAEYKDADIGTKYDEEGNIVTKGYVTKEKIRKKWTE